MSEVQQAGDADGPTAPDAQAAPETPPTSAPETGSASGPAPEPTPEPTPEQLEALPARVEAALLTADRAMTAARLGEALDMPAKAVNDAIGELNAVYEQTGRSFRIEQVAGGWQVMTLPAYADVLANLHRKRNESKLTPAAMETLAIIAYKQPILRAEIESIRGVAAGEVLRSLMDRHLVKIAGRADEIGRPILYGTTKQFLEVFGLASLKDLPKVEELRPKG